MSRLLLIALILLHATSPSARVLVIGIDGGSWNVIDPMLAAGRSPSVHGVTDFFSTRATIAVPTIDERLAAQEKRVGLYEVLMSWPPPALPNGFVVPAWLRRDETTWPPDALEESSHPSGPRTARSEWQPTTRPARN
jgi:hypothetical protein